MKGVCWMSRQEIESDITAKWLLSVGIFKGKKVKIKYYQRCIFSRIEFMLNVNDHTCLPTGFSNEKIDA